MDISTETWNDKKSKLEGRIETYQMEFWDIMLDLIDRNPDRITEKKPKYYWVERLKELQININHTSNFIREVQLQVSREALEEAFTPTIKKSLIENYRNKIEELENE